MIYEHPLAYLLGLEGVALLRGFIGECDREFVEARIAEASDRRFSELRVSSDMHPERILHGAILTLRDPDGPPRPAARPPPPGGRLPARGPAGGPAAAPSS